jgi:large repetitive protein
MKKITLVIFAFLLSFSAFAQFPEGFEGTWTAGSGPAGWAIINNAPGLVQQWRPVLQADGTTTYPPHTGTNAAFINRETVPVGSVTDDWLITPEFVVPTEAQLTFWSRLTVDGDQGTIYKIFIGNSTTDITQFTEIKSWTELQLNIDQQTYEEKRVDIPATYVGQTLRLAFVMRGRTGDRWVIDDVNVVSRCLAPTRLGVVGTPTATGANLTWTENNSATAWEIEVVKATDTPTGSGQSYSGELPYPATGLESSTVYNFYVRSKCQADGTNNSVWAGPFTFTTPQEPAQLDWSTNFDSGNPSFTLVNGAQTNKWIVGTATSNSPTKSLYITSDNDGLTNFYVNTSATVAHAYRDVFIPDGAGELIFKYDWKSVGEPDNDYLRVWSTPQAYNPVAGSQTVAINNNYVNHSGNLNGDSSTAWTTNTHSIDVTAYGGTVRRFIFEWTNNATNGGPPPAAVDNVSFTLIRCPKPTNLMASVNMTTADLSWTQPGSPNQWEVYAVPATSPAPGATTTGVVVNGTPAYTMTNLTPGTAYKYYVRALCGGDGQSEWSGPYNFIAQFCNAVDQCAYTFNMTDTGGDGWVEGTMEVRQNGNTIAVLSLNPVAPETTISSGSQTVTVCNGIPISLVWTVGGDYPREMGVSIQNNFGQTIYTSTPRNFSPNVVLFTGAVDCATPLCITPTGLTANTITDATANLVWGNGGTGGTSTWEYYLVPAGTAAPTATTTGVATATSTVPVTGLTPNTTYNYYVRMVCNNGASVTAWSAVYTFTTTQVPAPLNYTDDFEGTFLWSTVNGTQANKWFYGTAVSNSPTHSLYVSRNATGNNNLYNASTESVTQVYRDIAVPAGTRDVNIAFDWKGIGEFSGSTIWDYVTVYVVPTTFRPTAGTTMVGANLNGGTQLARLYNQTTWTRFNQIFNASAYAGSTMRLVFQWRNDGSGYNGSDPIPGAIDNVVLTRITCPQPIAIAVPAASVTAFTAVVNWTETGVATSWEVLIQPASAPAPTATSTGVVVTDASTYTATNLTPNTSYVAYVRAVCGDNDKSFWSGPTAFATPVTCPQPLAVTVPAASVTAFTAVVNWREGGAATSWEVIVLPASAPAPTATSTGTVVTGTPTFTATGLTSDTPFIVYVRAICSDTDKSLWSGPASFRTPVTCPKPLNITIPPATITLNSAVINWTEAGTATSWEVIVQHISAPAPTPASTGTIVTGSPTFTATGLIPSTTYVAYIRAVCSTTDNSSWSLSGPTDLITLQPCNNPTGLVVNCLTSEGVNVVWNDPGGIAQWEATVQLASAPVPASGTIINVPNYTYEGNFVANTSYTIYVRTICPDGSGFSYWTTNTFTMQSTSVGEAQALCAGVLGVPQPSQADDDGIRQSAYGTVGCLSSTPNPTWYYVTLNGSGAVALDLRQVSDLDGQGIDVDFAIFGPYDNKLEACSDIGGREPLNITHMVDCSFSASAVERIDFTGNPGDVFAILVTNYDGDPGHINITQISGPSLSCDPTVELGPDKSFCNTASYNLTARVDNPGAVQPYTYTWYKDTLPFSPTIVSTTADSQTIEVTDAGTHVYKVVLTMPNPVSTNVISDTTTITLSHPFAPPVYTPIVVCSSLTSTDVNININYLGTLDPALYTVVGVYPTMLEANLGTTGAINTSALYHTGSTTLYAVIADALSPGCKQIAPLQITVGELTGTLNYTPVVCQGDAAVLPGLVQVGGAAGTYEATPPGLTIDVNTGVVTPLTSSPGVYHIVYTIPAQGNCSQVLVEDDIEIIRTPMATISYSSAYCNTAGAFATVDVTGDTGGTFAGDTGLVIDPATGAVDLGASTATLHTVTYTPPANGTCVGLPVQTTIQINAQLTGTFDYPRATYCVNEGTANVTNFAGSINGTYKATPDGLTIDPVTGAIDLATSQPNVYDIVYHFDATATCGEYTSPAFQLTVVELPVTTIDYGTSPYCNTAGFTANANINGTQGGTFAANPSLTINPATGEIDLGGATPDTYTITYSPPATGPCIEAPVTTTVVISTSLSSVITGLNAAYCTDGGTATPVLVGDTGGAYEVTPATGLSIDATTGVITLGTTTPGQYSIRYHIVSAGACGDFFSQPVVIDVYEAPDAATVINYSAAAFCTNAGIVTATVTGTQGGTYAVDHAGLSINLTTGEIDTAASTPDTYYVTYTTPTTAPCIPVTTPPVAVTIVERPTVSISYAASPYCSNGGVATVTPTGTGAYTGGTYSSASGLRINAATGDIDLALSEPGTYDVIYTVTGPAGCGVITSLPAAVVITRLPEPNFTYTTLITCNAPGQSVITPSYLSVYGTAGTFTVSGTPGDLAINLATGVIDPSGSVPGIYTITNTITGTDGCVGNNPVSNPVVVEITPAPVADFGYSAPAYCQATTTVVGPTLTGVAGNFTSTPAGLSINSTTGAIDVAASAPGTYEIINTVAATATCPKIESLPVTVTITSAPVITTTDGCVDGKYTLQVYLDTDPVYSVDDVDIVWTMTSETGATVSTQETAIITTPGTYYVKVTPKGGVTCPAVLPVTVASTICNIQKGISPGGTMGQNDEFDLSGLDVRKISIYNRYGKEVYKFEGHYTNQWHGQTNGNEELPTGTYFYTFVRSNGEVTTNWIYVNREVK